VKATYGIGLSSRSSRAASPRSDFFAAQRNGAEELSPRDRRFIVQASGCSFQFLSVKRHGRRALREAVRDAANGNLLQENGGDIPPKNLGFPDESVWALSSPPGEGSEDDEESTDDDHELSDAADRGLGRLMDRLEDRAGK
jgi:hypothetical protein